MSGGYTPEMVVLLLPAVWDQGCAYGMDNPTAPDPDMPRSRPDPKVGGAIFAHLADIRIAWREAELPLIDRQALLLTYGLDWSQQEIAAVQGVSHQSVSNRLKRGLATLLAQINGKDWQDGDDAYDDADLYV